MRVLKGTIFGGLAYFLIGWLVYGIILMDFLLSNSNQCANRPGGEMIWWAIIASNMFAALLLTIFLDRSNAVSISDGLVNGAIFGALFTATIDLSFWSMTTMYNSFGPIVVEIAAGTVIYALVGMVIVLTWGKRKTGLY